MNVLKSVGFRLAPIAAVFFEFSHMGLKAERAACLLAILLPGTALDVCHALGGPRIPVRTRRLKMALQCLSAILIVAYAEGKIGGINVFAMIALLVGGAEVVCVLLGQSGLLGLRENGIKARASGIEGDIGRAVSGLEALCVLIEDTMNAQELRRCLRFLDEEKRLDEDVPIDALSFSAAVFQAGMLLERQDLVLAFLARLQIERPNVSVRIESLRKLYELRSDHSAIG